MLFSNFPIFSFLNLLLRREIRISTLTVTSIPTSKAKANCCYFCPAFLLSRVKVLPPKRTEELSILLNFSSCPNWSPLLFSFFWSGDVLVPAVLVETLLDMTVAAAAWLATGYCKEQKDIRH